MLDSLPFVFAVIVWAVLVFLTVRVATSKERSPVLWGIFAAIFPIIALIVIILLPKANSAP